MTLATYPETDVMLSLKSNRRRLMRAAFIALALAASVTVFLAITPRASAQADVPDAPTAVAVYSIESQKLEVRWSSSATTTIDSFKIQWKSGSEEFDSTRQLTSDPATSIESDQSTSAGDRYKERLAGLTDGTEYTVRVMAANSNGDSDPSAEATGTPATTPGEPREFIENEVVEIFESSYPWLRETWDYVVAQNPRVTSSSFSGGSMGVQCSPNAPMESNLRKCYVAHIFFGMTTIDLIRVITHELAHVYTLSNGVTSAAAPLGVAHLYFAAWERREGGGCYSHEYYADALTNLIHGDPIYPNYLIHCSFSDSLIEEAVAVARSAASGTIPSWFATTYNDANGDPDLERLWALVRAMPGSNQRAAVVFQLRDAFGGYCNNHRATDSAFGRGLTRNPWNDGGCVPDAPANASATEVGSGKLTVSWHEPPGDGGSPITGYKVQWKSGSEEYESFRQSVVTNFSDLRRTIIALTNGVSHSIRVLAYNHNGDGAPTEITATPTATDTTAPTLLTARVDRTVLRLTWREALDTSSKPSTSAFTVSVDASARAPNEVSISGGVVTLTLESAVDAGDAVTVSYSAPAGSTATPLKDVAGNNVSSFSAQTVRNDTTQVAITSDPGSDLTYIWDKGSGSEDTIEVTVTFSENVLVSGVPTLGLLIGGETRSAAYSRGSGTTSLVFRYTLSEGETETVGIRVPDGAVQRGSGLVRYDTSNLLAPARVTLGPQTGHLVDAVRPVMLSAVGTANRNVLTVAWDKALDESSVPTRFGRGFVVRDTSANVDRFISAISVLGKVVTLTVSPAISATDQLTVHYSVPFRTHPPLKDAIGNYAGSNTAIVSINQRPNSPPEFPSSETGARSVDENTAAGRNIGAPLSATDADNDRRTYSISGTDAAFFDVVASSGQLRTKGALNHESRDSYSFTMSVHDGKDVHGYADTTIDATITVTVTVDDVDEPPVISGVTTIDDYDENGSGDVATYTATDPEGATTFTWSLGGPDSGDFDIAGGVLSFKNAPDYERPAGSGGGNHYEVTVRASDPNSNRGQLHVDVIVSDLDEPPELSGPDTVADFPENSATIRQVGRYTATDPEGATVTLSLPSGGADFALASSGVLTFRESPDYEQRRSYSVTVRAAAGSHTVAKVVTVNIQNVEETGAITLSAVQPQEGTTLTATLEDDDGPTGTAWQWYRTSSRGSTGTAITNANSRSYTPDTDDVGSYLRAVASYDDGHGTGKSAAAVSAHRVQEAPPVPESPVFPADGNYDRSIRENLPVGRNLGDTVTATDGNNDRLTYSIAASDFFEIVESTGQLRTKVELDHEDREQHFLTVTATDPGGLADTVSVTVTVEDVDETPEVSGPSSLEFEEGTSVGATLATYTSTDPDRKGIDLVLSGADSGDFSLSGSTLTFNEPPDFEEPADSNRDNRYQVTVEAREQGDGASIGRLNVTISVTNVNEPGLLETNVEEPRVGQTVRLNVADEDGGVSVMEWKWERGEPNSPCGTVGSPTVTTWETINGPRSGSYTPTVADQGHCIRVTAFYDDRVGAGNTEQFLTPNSVEVGPFFNQDPPAFGVRENTAEGVTLGQVRASHSDNGETLTYSLAGADAGYFTIDDNAQLLTSATTLDYESGPGKKAVVEITAVDNNGQTATISVTVSVTDDCANSGEPPCAPGRPSVSSLSTSSLKVTWSTPGTPSGTSIIGYELQSTGSQTAGAGFPKA